MPSKIEQTDIVIPAYGQPMLLRQCVAAAVMYSSPETKILIVDDCTPSDPAFEVALDDLVKLPNVSVRRRKKNGGFVAAANQGAGLGEAPYIVFLNSDVVVMPGTLEQLMTPFEHPDVGVVGAKLLFPDNPADASKPAGKVQHAGIAFDSRLLPIHVCIGWSADNPKVNYVREMQAVTGALFATTRELWNQLRGFDSVYGRGTCEDVDYCLRTRAVGKGVIYNPGATAYHYVGASLRGVPPEMGFPYQRNLQLLQLRMNPIILWDEWRFW